VVAGESIATISVKDTAALPAPSGVPSASGARRPKVSSHAPGSLLS
jgi:hypothetical protein